MRTLRLFAPVLAAALILFGCGGEDDEIWTAPQWHVAAAATGDHVIVTATVANVPGNFIHMSIRREGYDSGYTVERSPAPNQPERDWSRVHHWFGTMHPDTYLEGRIDDGSGRGPSEFQTFAFSMPRDRDFVRLNFPDDLGGEHEYITRGYAYADGQSRHPAFEPGTYEVVVYAWYTGRATATHPAADGGPGVQHVHYERPLASAVFVIE